MLFCQARTAWHWASTPGSACSRQLDRLRPRMPGMRSGCVLPAPLPPPTPRTGYSLSREARGHPLYGKTTGHVVGTAPALGWALGWALGTGEPGGAGTMGGAHSGSGQDRGLLRTYYVPRASFTGINSITPTLRFSFPGEETETRRSQGTCLRVPAGKWQRQTWSKPV